MRDSDLNSLGVSRDEVKALLAHERRPAIRKRLVAIGGILAGSSVSQAAHAAKAGPASVDRWIRQIRRSGFPSLLVDGRRGHARQRMTPSEAAQTRQHIAAALARPLKPQVRARLVAMDAVVSGQPIDEVAAAARVLPCTVREWLRLVTRNGVDAAVDGWQTDRRLRPGRLDADPAMLHELAAKEINPRVRKRIHALACIAEGMSTYDADAKVRLNPSAITKRVKRFQEEGIAAFQDKERWRKKLTAGQIHQLRAEILNHPNMHSGELRMLIEAFFGVHYSCEGLRLLLKRDLRIVRKKGSFIEAALPSPAGQRPPSPTRLSDARP